MSRRAHILWRRAAVASVLVLWPAAIPGRGQNTQYKAHPSNDEFFIISSVDAPKKELVLKFPTEVTELVAVNEKTTIQNEQGRPLALGDLRAGDTVYVTTVRTSQGTLLATRIRRGPMTLSELRRRYLKTLSGNE
jgi:hypothetical protein